VGGSPLTNALNVIAERGLLANTVALGGMNLPMAIAALELLDEGVDATSVEQLLVMGKDGVRAVDLAIDDDEDEEL
jgi:PTS system N-acetylgalactosamine-specific IIA component